MKAQAKRKWRRGEFTIALTPDAVNRGISPQVSGWVLEPFGVHQCSDGNPGVTHVPTGNQIAGGWLNFTSFVEAKNFAERLIATGFDWSGPRRAKIGYIPTKRSAWFHGAEKSVHAVYEGAS